MATEAAAIAIESNLKGALESGKFVVTAELGPPKSADRQVIETKAELLMGWADAINVTDNQTAVTRMSSLAACTILKTLGLDPVFQITCRDRNRIALQSDVLGAYALGIRNVLCLTGDHQSFGNHPQAKGVFDLDSTHLISTVRRMRDQGRFLSGDELVGEQPAMFIGAVANPFAPPYEFRALRLKKKVEAGAQFIQTQIVYNISRFKEFVQHAGDLGLLDRVYILAGVSPIKTPGAVRYMRDNVPGLDVPDVLVTRMKTAGEGIEDKQARSQVWRREGIEICVEIIQQLREIQGVAGVHIMAIEWEEAVPQIVEQAGLRASAPGD
ncbi:MAG: methylenetetrahydrofolate reductase [Anaerolineae bacterium]